MTKYSTLTKYLTGQRGERVPMTFTEIEKVIGAKLPASSGKHRAWWSNNPSNNVMTKAWLEAGFESEQVDLDGRKLTFRRVRPSNSSDAPTSGKAISRPASKLGLFGWLRGTVSIPRGVDLTEPADPEWGKRVDDGSSSAA